MSTPYNVDVLLQEVQVCGSKLSSNDDEARRQCLRAVRSLSYALESPLEAILRICYAEPAHQAAIRTGIDIDLFAKLDEGPRKTLNLAESTGTDPVLLARLLKHLAAMGTIYETVADEYLPTPLSKALIQPIYRDGFPHWLVFRRSHGRSNSDSADTAIPATQALPQFLHATKYRNPENAMDCPFQAAFSTKEHCFAWMAQRPEVMTHFHNHMEGTRAGMSSWMDIYPFEDNLVKGSEEGSFLVDVGGSKGHDLQELCRRYPDLSRDFILQDLPGVVKDATSLDRRIQPMAHDFFTTEPVKHARAYFLHRILHDWPDDSCRVILMNLKAAMKKGYSRLLINENVIPDKGADMVGTGLDILMMSLLAARERTESDWRILLESVGFEVIKVWHADPASESLIEAEVA